ncbi:MAG: YacL family protein [Gammaproteobacteria bacterium]|nr:YacL family protein [Gammaproteobacteria bacterium]
MDYEFRRDLYGRYQARFSMGHEALGLWLTEELAANQELTDSLLDKIEHLKNSQCREYHQNGKEFTLHMSREGIEIHSLLLDNTFDEAPEELSFYDQESYASCGLDDFQQLLLAWQTFTKK